ncbi:ParA family protein [Borreliella burgdorferi]|uniref:ParA family protein n=1 Tax=Borreliella burgdorferi TaxID=139 RepID=UPI001E5996E2|nr:ParA family protein [Borreliella burgdorferi]MCD2383829.1 ParA family protein [Borreliella burgdorferi]MCD2389986.1 ParA family protein [Borreliella burgdorferi]MCD2394724.1 ParA family protein [Borreliella burgdorferi]MCD2395983.1 ParA family protein [Borreliella burgdorferi]MCD2397157.1 ParA family protein [Borreliella burgdorferi]
MDTKKPKIMTIASNKGGVGKSTSSIIFATLLAQKYKVLLIDMDSQASTTSYFFDKITNQNISVVDKNIYSVLKEKLDINNAVVSIKDNLDLIPSYFSLHKFSSESISLKKFRLKNNLIHLKQNYDYIVIDTSPSLDFTLSNALIASNCAIAPITAEKWTIESLDLLEFYINSLKIKIPIFIFVTRFKKNGTHKEILKHVESKKRFLGFIHEREDLNKKIAGNYEFNMFKDYINEYQEVLSKFFVMYEKYI